MPSKFDRTVEALKTPRGRNDILAQLVAPGKVMVSEQALAQARDHTVQTENRLKTALGTIGVVYLVTAPAAALQTHRRGGGTGATILAGLLGPLALAWSGYREGLR